MFVALLILLPMLASAQTVNIDTIKQPVKSDTPKGLNGKLPGFFAKSSSAKAGKDADFYIDDGPYKPDRSKQPLILLNGKKISYKKLQKIDIHTIKAIQIVKDSAAYSKYGRKAKNGTLVITTNKSSSP